MSGTQKSGTGISVGGQIEYRAGSILSKEVSKGRKFSITLFCMAKGTAISSHTSSREGLVYVIEGKGAFRLEGKDIMMRSGVLICMDSNAVHSLRADEDTSFLLML